METHTCDTEPLKTGHTIMCLHNIVNQNSHITHLQSTMTYTDHANDANLSPVEASAQAHFKTIMEQLAGHDFDHEKRHSPAHSDIQSPPQVPPTTSAHG